MAFFSDSCTHVHPMPSQLPCDTLPYDSVHFMSFGKKICPVKGFAISIEGSRQAKEGPAVGSVVASTYNHL
jgi:hypothetical protein